MGKEGQFNREEKPERMMSVWEWSAIVLGTYGFLIFIAGNLFSAGKSLPEKPSLWWGAFMMVFSILMFFLGRREKTRTKKIDINNSSKFALAIATLLNIFYTIISPTISYSQRQRVEEWEFFHPDPSLEGTGGLFRTVSPRTLDTLNFSIGTYFGYFNTPDSKVIVISRDHFVLKEKRELVRFEKSNSYGFYNYINVSAGLPKIIFGGIISSDISISMRNSSAFLEFQPTGKDEIKDNAQVQGDFIITPKISYLFEKRNLSFSLWPKVAFLSQYRKSEIGAVSWGIGFSALYDFDEDIKSETLSLINPKLILSSSYNIDNSRILTQNSPNLPPYVETQLMIEPYNHIDISVGVDVGNSKRGIGKFISGFVEYSLMHYIPVPELAGFFDMPMYISVGVRGKPIPLITQIIKGIPEEIKELSFSIVVDFNISRSYIVPPLTKIEPEVEIRNSPFWKLFFGVNLIWAPWERRFLVGEGGRIRGRVIDDATGGVIQDAIVSFPDFQLTPQATDEYGEFLSYEMPPGEWTLMVRKEGYEVFATKVEVPKGETKNVEIRLRKVVQRAVIYGRVLSSDGKSINAARIESEGTNIPPSFSAYDGKFEMVLMPGKHKIKVSAPNYNPAEVQVVLSPGEKKKVDFILEPIQEVIETVKPGEVRVKEVEKKIIIEKGTNRILLPEKLLFEHEKATVLSVSLGILKELADFINEELKGKKIRIEVHTDPIRDPEFDRNLTQKRAEFIADVLARFGVPRENLIPVGKGSDFPIASNETPEGRSINRRVDFFVVEQ
jgi:OOP family OmpA-OmpF porin